MDEIKKRYHILRYSSIFYRSTQSFFNERLQGTGIGAGQQYFLDHIARTPGIGITQLAQTAEYDNGTCAKAVRKLIDEGYVYIVPDEADGRIKRLYPTDKAGDVVEKIREMKRIWRTEVMRGFSDEEKERMSGLIRRLSDNAVEFLKADSKGGDEE